VPQAHLAVHDDDEPEDLRVGAPGALGVQLDGAVFEVGDLELAEASGP